MTAAYTITYTCGLRGPAVRCLLLPFPVSTSRDEPPRPVCVYFYSVSCSSTISNKSHPSLASSSIISFPFLTLPSFFWQQQSGWPPLLTPVSPSTILRLLLFFLTVPFNCCLIYPATAMACAYPSPHLLFGGALLRVLAMDPLDGIPTGHAICRCYASRSSKSLAPSSSLSRTTTFISSSHGHFCRFPQLILIF